ncbi:response regulator transcription factor [Phycicoccus sp. M110.8]|uniref:response regulator transcription factor n=1 Tax=Phycicoccus sp. M110.8 TaxID=3075433 RepID=UPI0028FD0F2B|nr:response regulator transcription factor [Phycicoccus sp. M110.8]MDU0315823.1 response regulator transcription factor [Phycicoccus sp. M110.8]HET8766615.1 response regulator transcription factor [Pedococcus sp.]
MRIVVCDDHLLLLEALGLALGARGHEVLALAESPDEAVEAVAEHHPDVCLLDVNFPGGTSLTAIHRIRELSPSTKVVMLSAEADHAIVGRAIAEGASGYVGKEKPIVEIVEMLDRAVRGQLAVEPSLLQRALRPQKSSDDPLWALQFLTDREWQVMRCIMDGQTTEEMAASLGVQRSTARTHVQNLLTKLGVHSRLQAAALLSAHGSQETWPAHLR